MKMVNYFYKNTLNAESEFPFTQINDMLTCEYRY